MNSYPKYFTEVPVEVLWQFININMSAATMMSHMLLPSMAARCRGAIINLSSASAVGPLPLMAVYSASKAYVDYLSQVRFSIFVSPIPKQILACSLKTFPAQIIARVSRSSKTNSNTVQLDLGQRFSASVVKLAK
jgi:hypothetical protein